LSSGRFFDKERLERCTFCPVNGDPGKSFSSTFKD